MNIILQYAFLFLPLGVHLLHDLGEINRGVSPKHGRNLAILAAFTLLMGFHLQWWAKPEVSMWQYALYAGCIHFATFNYLLNRLRKPPVSWFHLGTGPFDSLLLRLGLFGMIFLQLWVLMLGYSVYYHWDWITGKALPYIP